MRDVSDAGENVGEPGLQIDIIELGRHDQRRHGRRPIGAAFGAGEEPRLPIMETSAQAQLCVPRDYAQFVAGRAAFSVAGLGEGGRFYGSALYIILISFRAHSA